MGGNIDVITLVFLVVAVAIFIKLRSVLGRRTGHEQTRIERYRAQQEARQRNGELVGQDKIVTLPRREREGEEMQPAGAQQARADGEQRVREFAAGNSEISQGLVEIFRADPAFDPGNFLQGAKAAYEIIVTAFAEGNRKTLKNLLNSEVYDGFVGAIGDRERRGEQIDQSFVGIKSADLVEAELKGGVATDIWTFARDVASRDPNWKLVATQAAN
jgi:predicted lipid-binding transport protein (Tim44 family)